MNAPGLRGDDGFNICCEVAAQLPPVAGSSMSRTRHDSGFFDFTRTCKTTKAASAAAKIYRHQALLQNLHPREMPSLDLRLTLTWNNLPF